MRVGLSAVVAVCLAATVVRAATLNQVLYDRGTFTIGKLTRQFTVENDSIQRQVFGALSSGAAYSVDGANYFGVFSDPLWSRLVLMPEGSPYGTIDSLLFPSWVDASPFGRVFIADTGHDRILIYAGVTSEIAGATDFAKPTQVLWDDNGTPNDYSDELIWVLDPFNAAIVGYHLVDNTPAVSSAQRYVRLSQDTAPWSQLRRPIAMTKRRGFTTPNEEGSFCTTRLVVFDAARDAFLEYDIPRAAGELPQESLSTLVTVTQTPNPVPGSYWRCIVSDAWGNILGIDGTSGKIYKFDSTFQVLDIYGIRGQGPFGTQQLWEPVSLSFVKTRSTGGSTRYSNNAVLCEEWGNNTGVQRLTMGLSSSNFFSEPVPNARDIKLSVTLTDHCRTSAWIEDVQTGAILRTLATNELRPAGRVEFVWDGKSASGTDLPPCTTYRFRLRAVGLYASPESVTISQTFYYKPRIKYALSLFTNRPGSNVTVDARELTIGAGGAAVACSLCTTHAISVPPTQMVDGVRQCFDSWSDNASRIRTVSLTRDSTITLSLTAGPGPTSIPANAAVLDEAYDCKSPYVFQGSASLSNRAGWDSFRVYGNVKFQLPMAQGSETRAHLNINAPLVAKGVVFETIAPPGTQTPGLWKGIVLTGYPLSGSVDCDSCTIRNAQIGVYASDAFPVRSLKLRRSRFEFNETNDVLVAFDPSAQAQATITDNVFDNPSAIALTVGGTVVATVASAVIDGNAFNGGYAPSTGMLRLEGGWGGFIRANTFNASWGTCLRLDRYIKSCGTGCQQDLAWPAPEIHENFFQIATGTGNTALWAPKMGLGYPIPTTIDATSNRWGTYNSQPDIAQLVQDASDNSAYAVVNYTPWTAPVASATSYYVPQAGTVANPSEGTNAARFFRACPNNDGGSSFFNNARIKIVLKDAGGVPLAAVPATDVFIRLNGGTVAQSFSGPGADSIIANSYWNYDPPCPNLRYLYADAPTDANGVTYITFRGASSSNPGVAVRDPSRKWGHYDSDLPVYAAGFRLDGRLTSGGPNGSYVLRIKSMDLVGGLGSSWPIDANTGEWVDGGDFNVVANGIDDTGPLSYWKDLDSSGSVDSADFNLVVGHYDHKCSTPYNP